MHWGKKITFSLVLLTCFMFPLSSTHSEIIRPTVKENYIILTTQNLLPGAELFKKYREKDFNVSIVTLSGIGSSEPEKIRTYLINHFRNGYLLIIGSEKTIPRPAMYPSEKVHTHSYNGPSKTETDIYYGLLSENIDKDRDGFPGELWDDRMSVKPDLIVGRIPFDTNEEVKEVFESTVNFESNPPDKAVLAASFISCPGEVYQGAKIFNGDGAREEELISRMLPVKSVKLYDKSGDFPTIYKCELNLTKENFYNAIADSAFTDWVAHGSPDAAYNEIWHDKNHNGIPDDGYEFKSFISKDDDFTTNGIFFSGSCLNENGSNNLGSVLLKKGAVSFVGSTEISFSPSYFTKKNDGGTGSMNYYFVKNLVNGETVGQALYNSFEYFFNNLLFNDIEDPCEGSLMDIYDYNIYGDPALRWNFKKEKTTDDVISKSGKSPVSIDITGNRKITINLGIPKEENLFMLFPAKNIFITNVSDKSAIIDNTFGIIRLNGSSGNIIIRGIARGTINSMIRVTDSYGTNYRSINVNGYNIKDFNFDGIVNNTDFSILSNSFGRTYMDKGFDAFCDLNYDHKIDGLDLFRFLFP